MIHTYLFSSPTLTPQYVSSHHFQSILLVPLSTIMTTNPNETESKQNLRIAVIGGGPSEFLCASFAWSCWND
jgi:hypothetical protein